MLFVVGTAAEIEPFGHWLGDAVLLARLQQVDYRTTVVVAAFAGPRPSTGYAITIQAGAWQGDEVRLTAVETAPAPGQAVLEVITYPFHLVAIPREVLPTQPLRWRLLDPAGQVLAETCWPG
jgi:hypothetical protein